MALRARATSAQKALCHETTSIDAADGDSAEEEFVGFVIGYEPTMGGDPEYHV